jgi:FtsZ-binding cell division protein ZapB
MTEKEIDLLTQIKEDIEGLKEKVEDLDRKFEGLDRKFEGLDRKFEDLAKDQEQSQKWQDKTWDVLKWVGGISAGLSISAAIALVGIVLRFSIGQ